jgi:hypothetical protein
MYILYILKLLFKPAPDCIAADNNLVERGARWKNEFALLGSESFLTSSRCFVMDHLCIDSPVKRHL